MVDEIPGFAGPFDVPPENVIPVDAFGFGFGSVAGVDEEGVRSHPVVLLLTNAGDGPTLMLNALSVQTLVTGLMGAGLKSLTAFDPNLKEVLGESAGDDMFRMLGEMEKTPDERQRAKEDKATSRLERLQLLYGLSIIVVGIVMSPFLGWGWFITTVVIYFAVQGFTINALRGWFTFRRWRRERGHKRDVKRTPADVDGLRPPN